MHKQPTAVADYCLRKSVQQLKQMQRAHAICHKYEISHLKRLTIKEWPSRTLKVITIAAITQAV